MKENVNNVITIREADWPMLWRVSNASLDYTHGSSPLTGWPCVTQSGDGGAMVTMPPSTNPTGESSFDCATPMAAASNAAARPSPQANGNAASTATPAADAQVEIRRRPFGTNPSHLSELGDDVSIEGLTGELRPLLTADGEPPDGLACGSFGLCLVVQFVNPFETQTATLVRYAVALAGPPVGWGVATTEGEFVVARVSELSCEGGLACAGLVDSPSPVVRFPLPHRQANSRPHRGDRLLRSVNVPTPPSLGPLRVQQGNIRFLSIER